MELLDRSFIESELKWWNIPGVEMGVVRVNDNGIGETIFSGGWGLRDKEADLPMTADTLGGIASCSKAFTAAVVSALVDDGVLDYDRPIREYIPDFDLMDPFAARDCCLRDLLYHRSGLPGHDAMWPNPNIDSAQYIRRVRFLEPNKPFRSVSQYNNTVYNLIGFIAEQASGIPYETLVRERVLKPLGMDRTTISLKEMNNDPDHAVGYFAEEVGVTPAPVLRRMEGWEMNHIGNPAAGVNSCVTDMLKWITLHINNGVYEGKRLFSQNVMLQMHDAAVKMAPFPWRFPEIPGYGLYGMGWKTSIYRGEPLVYHGGEIEGYCCITCFMPRTRLGCFILVNRHTMMMPFLMEMIYTAFDRAMGCEPVDWAERLHAYANNFTDSCYSWKLDLMPAPFCDMDSALNDPSACSGVYTNPAYGHLTITHGKPESAIGVSYMPTGRDLSPVDLYLHYAEWILPLETAHGLGCDTFKITNLKEDTLFYTIPLTFVRNTDGAITGFTLKLEREVAPILFTKI